METLASLNQKIEKLQKQISDLNRQIAVSEKKLETVELDLADQIKENPGDTDEIDTLYNERDNLKSEREKLKYSVSVLETEVRLLSQKIPDAQKESQARISELKPQFESLVHSAEKFCAEWNKHSAPLIDMLTPETEKLFSDLSSIHEEISSLSALTGEEVDKTQITHDILNVFEKNGRLFRLLFFPVIPMVGDGWTFIEAHKPNYPGGPYWKTTSSQAPIDED